ncbi:MAG: CBU_0592 family membrane protein [Candidatus Cyclobacteriaceae bacterium M2_1C_046]
MSFADLVTTAGVSLILLAFLLLTLKKVSSTDKLYHILNLLGAGLACYGAILIESVPFVVLEGIWAAASVYGLIRS